MSLKAGRVGVNPADVDPMSGHISPDAADSYTKVQADDKFLSKSDASSTYETKSDAADLQPKTLSVPISMLVGSQLVPKSTVEDVLATMNNAMTNRDLTEMATVKEGEVTSDFTLDSAKKKVYKNGHVVCTNIKLTGVTAMANSTTIVTIPEGFRPKEEMELPANVEGNMTTFKFFKGGGVQSLADISNKTVRISGISWMTS